MRAIVYTKYGPPPEALRVQEIDKPSPKDNEVLVKVHAASVNALDWRLFTLPRIVVKVVGLLTGIGSSKDKSLGADFAGRVEASRSAASQSFGYGFFVGQAGGVQLVNHGGTGPGIDNVFDLYPDLGYVVVILANRDAPAAQDIRALTRQVMPSLAHLR